MSNPSDPLVQFASSLLISTFDGDDIDGADIQALAVRLGLLEPVAYDPVRDAGKIRVGGEYLQPGDTWYKFAGPLA